jgi:hypothetical protein
LSAYALAIDVPGVLRLRRGIHASNWDAVHHGGVQAVDSALKQGEHCKFALSAAKPDIRAVATAKRLQSSRLRMPGFLRQRQSTKAAVITDHQCTPDGLLRKAWRNPLQAYSPQLK